MPGAPSYAMMNLVQNIYLGMSEVNTKEKHHDAHLDNLCSE